MGSLNNVDTFRPWLVSIILTTLLFWTTQSHANTVEVSYFPEPGASKPLPKFKVDASWPALPENWIIGQVPGLAIASDDSVWILHRPNSLSALDLAAAQTPATGLCCKGAPPVLQFSATGKLLQAWGGESHAPSIDGVNQWPSTLHGLFVDKNNHVWLGGNGKGDHVVLGFTSEGKFVTQLGQRLRTEGNASEQALGNPADIHHDTQTQQLLIADGYINKRVISFHSQTGQFINYWGAYGDKPGGGTRDGDFDVSQATANSSNSASAQHFGDIVHCVTKSSDGRIYVCDRRNNRLQVFTLNKQGNTVFERNVVIAGDTRGLGTATDVAFSPDNQYLYVADMMNGRVWVLWHDTYEVLGSFGRPGRYAGQFTWLHSVATDSKGNLYTSEVSTGRRVQKFVLQP